MRSISTSPGLKPHRRRKRHENDAQDLDNFKAMLVIAFILCVRFAAGCTRGMVGNLYFAGETGTIVPFACDAHKISNLLVEIPFDHCHQLIRRLKL